MQVEHALIQRIDFAGIRMDDNEREVATVLVRTVPGGTLETHVPLRGSSSPEITAAWSALTAAVEKHVATTCCDIVTGVAPVPPKMKALVKDI